jgi:hypothetical protein
LFCFSGKSIRKVAPPILSAQIYLFGRTNKPLVGNILCFDICGCSQNVTAAKMPSSVAALPVAALKSLRVMQGID